mmetsp:Transcript_5469/g.8147  ORF Transcript_5469/g.8147 Transcript_5469/m.8147 type:complete len:425 (-) Transcript_5469:184-1458(-)
MRSVVVSIILLLAIIKSLPTNAFPSQAGHCAAGPISAQSQQGPHGPVGGGELANNAYDIQVNGQVISPGIPAVLSAGIQYIFKLETSALTTFRGFMIRLEDTATSTDVSGVFTPMSSNLQLHPDCTDHPKISAVTHNENSDKQSVEFSVIVPQPVASLRLDVTAVATMATNNWFHSLFEFAFVDAPTTRPSAIPSAIPSTIPSQTPSQLPSHEPTSDLISQSPSQIPSQSPSQIPSQSPNTDTGAPTITVFPTSGPSKMPSNSPSMTAPPMAAHSKEPSSAPSLSSAPTSNPVEAPKTPTARPNAPTTKAPTGDRRCIDSPLPMFVNGRRRSCKWVGKKKTELRCAMGIQSRRGILAQHCPFTCRLYYPQKCNKCIDSGRVFVMKKSRNKLNCEWVRRRPELIPTRCSKFGVKETCPVSCNVCG